MPIYDTAAPILTVFFKLLLTSSSSARTSALRRGEMFHHSPLKNGRKALPGIPFRRPKATYAPKYTFIMTHQQLRFRQLAARVGVVGFHLAAADTSVSYRLTAPGRLSLPPDMPRVMGSTLLIVSFRNRFINVYTLRFLVFCEQLLPCLF